MKISQHIHEISKEK